MNYELWNNSPTYPIVIGSSGHTETIMNEDQLFRFLDKSCGSEVTNVIKYEIYSAGERNKCTGECDHTYETEEEYRAKLQEIEEVAEELLEIKSVQKADRVVSKLKSIIEIARSW